MSRKNPDINSESKTEKRKAKLKAVMEKRQPTITVVAENIYDPHNLSAMLRSCDAVGVLEVCLVYDGSQPYPKLGEKSSASAKKWVNLKKYESIKECYNELRAEGKKIYSTHMGRKSKSLYELDLTSPAALVFGNEHTGLSEEAASLADANFLIPQVGMIQSLNISVACAVSLYEAFRQRLNIGMYDKIQFDEEVFSAHLENWLKK
ncbi:TrmH family RNA methyltransferase [Bacteroidota bacterium]